MDNLIKTPQVIKCLQRNITFKQVHTKNLYCSRKCQSAAYRLKQLGEIKERDCECCGKLFLPKRKRTTKFCYECSSLVWAKNNPEKRKQAAKVSVSKRKEKNVEAYLEKRRQNAKKNQKWSTMKRKFGLTKDQYFELIQFQNNKCKICNNILDNGSQTHIDHCHKTGKVRGILCQKCNNGIGMFNDNIQLFYNAIQYLQQNK